MPEQAPNPIGSSPPAVDMRGIVKRFPGVVACDHVNLTVGAGEIMALLGENGAGKSTLMSVLSGLYRSDAGEIWLYRDGTPQRADIRSPRDAIRLGIGMVHQHFMLVPNQTVAENIILGLERPRFVLNMRQVAREVLDLSHRYRLQVDPSAYIWQLSVGEQQRVEILKLLYRGADVLILDEPTAVLTPQEAEELGRIMRLMAGEGKAIIFITHKLDEVMAFSDRVTVLRDGKNVATLVTAQTTKAELARLMVGREVLFRVERQPIDLSCTGTGQLALLSVQNVCAQNDRGLPALRNVSLEVCSGQILGIAGVAGNGQRELAEVVTGLRPVSSGRVLVRGQDLTNQPPARFIQAGVSHIPGDRLGMGLAGNLPVSDNLIMKAYRQPPLSSGPFLVPQAVGQFVQRLIRAFQVATPSPETPVRMLSGGNLQKTILAREITAGQQYELTLLVAVHPTRGLDVGATEAVHRTLLEQRAQGAGILLISEDLDELLALSDRIAVMFEGQIVGSVDAQEADVEHLGLMMAGGRRMQEQEVDRDGASC